MVNHVHLSTSFLDTQSDHVTQVIRRNQNVTTRDRLADLFDIVDGWQFSWAINVDDLFVGLEHFIHYGWCRGDEVEIVFAL
ncbi:Uncharacterised protein [Vibrio cholerae]|uniref:Uncharacterized protein n=1 Tax=Vibrio cholerae TaxID=666 RepID=A0A655Q341_VIBCL|nr:Uncharacterised protein [Vibrio cholerae]